MTHPVVSLTLDSARSCVMQSVFLTQGTVSSIPTIFNWGGSISPEGFWPSLLLLKIIIVAVAIVVAVVLVVVATIIGIVDVVVGVPSIIKLSFVITGVSLGPVFLLAFSVFTMLAACVFTVADKLTSRDKSLDLSAFKLSCLFFSLLSSGSLDRITQAAHLEANSLSGYLLSDLELLKDNFT
nr:hypothetical protein [Tanacetum cinerariifolium]